MTRQCAWCGSILGQAPPLENEATTHSICTPCAIDMLFSARSAEVRSSGLNPRTRGRSGATRPNDVAR
jgi:hypothetical protein